MSLTIDLTLNGGCCNSHNSAGTGASGNGDYTRDLIKITEANFANATDWNGSNNEAVSILPGYSLKVFYNEGNRYLDEGTEWERTSTGISILMDGFDATTISYTFYIHINKV